MMHGRIYSTHLPQAETMELASLMSRKMSIEDADAVAKILGIVVEHKQIPFRGILEQMQKEQPALEADKLRAWLQQLTEAELIAAKGAPLDDWVLYYPTHTGLGAERQTKRSSQRKK